MEHAAPDDGDAAGAGRHAKASRGDVFNLFIKKFQSQSLLEEYMKTSPYVMSQLEGTEVDPWSCIARW